MSKTSDTTASVSAEVAEMLPDALADVQAQMGRIDTKASMLLAGSLTALTVGVALLAKADFPVVVAAGAVIVLALIAGAVALLITAVRPTLRGNHGFIRWAAAPTANALLADLALTSRDHTTYRARRLLELSQSVYRKWQLVRLAVDLLRAALVVAALTAVLTAGL